MVDEVGYLTHGPDAANVLFQVVNDRYLHRRPMVFTTNKPVETWGKVLHDPDLAEAILDRILERGRVLQLKGPSFRTHHLQTEGRAKVYGKGVPGLTEPTAVDGVLMIVAPPQGSPLAVHRQLRKRAYGEAR